MITNQKVILLLGASDDQLFIIKTAKAMGLYVVVVDGNAHAPGFALADEFAIVSTRDLAGLIAFADQFIDSKKPIDAVAVMGSDISQYVSALAEHLNLPCVPLSTAMIATDKLLMKECFADKNLPIPWFSAVRDWSHLQQIIAERGLPLIIKPIDRSGARGVFLLQSGMDVEYWYKLSLQASFCQQVMVEEYLAGPQISAETIIYEGQAYTAGLVDRNYEKLLDFAPYIIENGGWQPSRVNEEVRQEVERLVESTAGAIGITHGVLKSDIVWTSSGAKIIEVATRLSGGDFSESLVPLGLGINYVRTALEIALGKEPDFTALTPTRNQAVANRYFFPPAGKLKQIHNVELVAKQPFVKKLKLQCQPGDIIPALTSHGDRVGVFIVVADSLTELEQRIAWVYDTIVFDICLDSPSTPDPNVH